MARFSDRSRQESAMTQANRHADPDLEKGAIEGPPNDSDAQGNRNAPAIDENGMPNDEVAIAEDVIGANEDETEG
jgi:hypothetical protein